ncbi:MAG TPA: acyltransferase family protein [Polyangiaceae bacterium]|nr:acyltransferase family protein [Polyangiaceae bacterium]
MQPSTQPSRSAGIDVIRGVCVLLVTLHHIHLRFKFNRFELKALLPEAVAKVVFWSGYFAVIAFFVLSGFLITTLSASRWASLDRISWRQFYWLRFSRIAPCLLLVVLLLSALHLAQAPGFVIPPERASLARAVLAALTFHINWLEGHHGYLPGGWDVLWSLSVEEVFYLSFPVVCLALRSERRLLLPLVALIVIGPFCRTALAGRDPWEDYAYLSCMDGIAFGCLAALLAARWHRSQRPPGLHVLRSMLALGIAAASMIVLFRGLPWSLGLHRVGLGVTVLELGVALILVALSQGVGSSLLARGTGWLRGIGRSSYEIYLTHMFVVLGLVPVIVAAKPAPEWLPAAYLALLLASVALGWGVQRVYSEPLNRALRRRAAFDSGRAMAVLLASCAALAGCQPHTDAGAVTAPSSRPALRVAITFDDLPSHGPLLPGQTIVDVHRQILDTLAAHRVPSVYGFINGYQLERHADGRQVLELWRAAGHPLGNHTWGHDDINEVGVEAFNRAIDRNDGLLAELVGDDAAARRSRRVFRYPYLRQGSDRATLDAVRAHLQRDGYRLAEVTVDFGDWAYNRAFVRCTAAALPDAVQALGENYVRRGVEFLKWSDVASRAIYGRDIPHVLLLHTGSFDAVMLHDLLLAYEREGVRWITLDEALDDAAYHDDVRVPSRYGAGLLEQRIERDHATVPPYHIQSEGLLAHVCRGSEPPAAAPAP